MMFTHVSLLAPMPSECAAFYGGVLGLPVTMEGDTAHIVAGATVLEFHPAPAGTHPTYHLAFNIVPNLLEAGRSWLRERVKLLTVNDDEVIEFPSWNAHALYFFDTAGNLLEFIARHDLPPGPDEVFGADHVLNLSELGVPVPDVKAAVAFLQQDFAIQPYSPASEDFAPLGNVQGLFILVREGRPWYPTEDMAAASAWAEVKIKSPAKTPKQGRAQIPGSGCWVWEE